MTEPRIEVKDESYGRVVTRCTGCGDERTYTQQPSPYGQGRLVPEAKADAAQHECFGAGRVGYVVEPSEEDPLDRFRERDSEGRCLLCLRNIEKQAAARRAQETQ